MSFEQLVNGAGRTRSAQYLGRNARTWMGAAGDGWLPLGASSPSLVQADLQLPLPLITDPLLRLCLCNPGKRLSDLCVTSLGRVLIAQCGLRGGMSKASHELGQSGPGLGSQDGSCVAQVVPA